MKTGICISGPGLDRAQAHRDARRPHRRGEVDEQREHDQPEQVDAVAVDLHPGRAARPTNSSTPTIAARTSADERVAGEDAEPVRRRQHQPPREAVLEVGRDPEAGEHAAERRRLQQHEHELERRVAGREVEARHVADVRQPAREGDEEEQREDQRRQQQLRVRGDLLDRAPGDARRRRRRSASCPHQPRPQGARRCRRSPISAIAAIAIPKPSASALRVPAEDDRASAGPRTGTRPGCRSRSMRNQSCSISVARQRARGQEQEHEEQREDALHGLARARAQPDERAERRERERDQHRQHEQHRARRPTPASKCSPAAKPTAR